MNKVLFVLLCLLIHIESSTAQDVDNSNPSSWSEAAVSAYQPEDSIKLYTTEDDTLTIYWNYILKPQNTLYRLAKLCTTSVEQILATNPMIDTKSLGIADTIKIPLAVEHIETVPQIDNHLNYIPLYYQVKKGQSLYSIARKIFDRSVLDLIKLNKLDGNYLRANQWLLVGYLPFAKDATLAPSLDTTQVDQLQKESKRLSDFAQAYQHEKIKEQKGIAYWRKSTSQGLFVLHRNARIGSIIELTNPMFDISIYAKVVGRLPQHAYTEDILVVISAGIARKLGALDSRFFIKIRYIE